MNTQIRFALLSLLAVALPVSAEEHKFQVTGLFAPDRVEDLRVLFAEIPDITLINIDYKNAEVTLDFEPKKAFPGAKPEQILQRLDNLVKNPSRNTFGVKPLRTVPMEKLKWIEIAVAGCDCKACNLAAYESVFKLDGVEQTTASFREGRVAALIDPTKTNRETLEAALKKKQVTVKTP